MRKSQNVPNLEYATPANTHLAMVAGKVKNAMGLQKSPATPKPNNNPQKPIFSRSFGVYFPKASAQVQPKPPDCACNGQDVASLLRFIDQLQENQSRLQTELLEFKLLRESVKVFEREVASKNAVLKSLAEENERFRCEALEREKASENTMQMTLEEENERLRNEAQDLSSEVARLKAKLNECSCSNQFQGLIDVSARSSLMKSLKKGMNGEQRESVSSSVSQEGPRVDPLETGQSLKNAGDSQAEHLEIDQNREASSECDEELPENSTKLDGFAESVAEKLKPAVSNIPKPPPLPPFPSSSSSISSCSSSSVSSAFLDRARVDGSSSGSERERVACSSGLERESNNKLIFPPPPTQSRAERAAAPPPPPPPMPAKLSRCGSMVRRVPEVVEFYHSLMRRDSKESKRESGPGVSEIPAAANARNMIGEIENRSSHLLAIKSDVEKQGDFIRFLIREVQNASFSHIQDVLPFVKWLDDQLSCLVDERAVLKHFEWPEHKADALREAAFGYCDLKKFEAEASSYRNDLRQPCAPALKKMQALLEKLEHCVYNLSRMREGAIKRYKGFNIPWEWMLDTGYVSQIKLASVKLAKKYIKRVASELGAAMSPEEKEELIVQGVRFAFRVHQFAGGFDVDTMRAFQELREKAGSCHAECDVQQNKLVCSSSRRSTPC
ncbi:uncharacterized protein LOC18442186 [Amborella trichopoda]|nr:uncharacterized protein LOC18442186 [Amborella trichopoda]|eukprot:XP_006852472.3 uncharacterized protein LOC18442186 [Amborella trichopoda]